MPDSTRPGSGPLIMEQLELLSRELKEMREAQDRRARQMQHLSKQVDLFLGSEINLSGTLVQVRELAANNRDGLAELRDEIRKLRRTIESTLALHVGDPGRERENGAN